MAKVVTRRPVAETAAFYFLISVGHPIFLGFQSIPAHT